MTRDRDIERVLDRWFDEGPTTMPDHLFGEVVDRIDRVPQKRLAGFRTRLLTMNSNLRLAAAAAIIVVVAGAGAYVLTHSPGVGVNPSSTPLSTPRPTAAAALLPTALQATWVGATRTVPQVEPAPTRSAFQLTNATFKFIDGGPTPRFFSTARLTAPDTIVLALSTAGNGCTTGDTGTYTFTLSGSSGGGGALALHPVADDCAARAAAISGDWLRSVCPDRNAWCLGDVEAGEHVSVLFNPFVPPTAWTSNFGALSYTVPAGWTNFEDCDGCYGLARQHAPENTGIWIWDDAVAHSQSDRCLEKAEPGVGRTAAAMTEWLNGLPGLVTTTPAPVSIGGLSGMMIDLAVAPSWTATCEYAYSVGLPLVSTIVDATPGGGLDWNIQGEGRTRLVFLDLPDGRTVVIDIEAQTKADYDGMLPEAMQVVNSFQFHP
jgi:hypothetical protein